MPRSTVFGDSVPDTRSACVALDESDVLADQRSHFQLPSDPDSPSTIYLDGNSLGPLPKNVSAVVDDTVNRQWGRSLIKGWNTHQWIDMDCSIECLVK